MHVDDVAGALDAVGTSVDEAGALELAVASRAVRHDAIPERDGDDAGVPDRRELVRRGLAVLIRVAPHDEVSEPRITGRDLSVAVLVGAASATKPLEARVPSCSWGNDPNSSPPSSMRPLPSRSRASQGVADETQSVGMVAAWPKRSKEPLARVKPPRSWWKERTRGVPLLLLESPESGHDVSRVHCPSVSTHVSQSY